MKKYIHGAFFGLFATILIGCGSNDEEQAGEEAAPDETSAEVEAETGSGGELIVGTSAQPDTLDPHRGPTTATRDMARHIYETLVTVNANYEVVPMLAEAVEQSEDGETITFHLREGISFHNGDEMKADDVVASMERWADESTIGRSNLENATFTAEDDYTVVLELEESSSVIMHVLAEIGQFAAIMPEEVLNDTGPTGVNEYVGTGPFEFVEWATDQHVHMKRFDDYQSVDEPSDGLSGEKDVQIEELYFMFVPDPSTRMTGLQTGEYDLIMNVPYDTADQIEEDPNLKSHVNPDSVEVMVFNEKEGLFTDQTARQAINTALDKEAIMTGAFSEEEYFSLDPGLMLPEQTDWYTDTGAEYYNQNDQDLAQELLDDAGYDGEEIVIMTTRDYDHHYNTGVVAQQQLEELGMNVSLNVLDWATFQEENMNPESYDIFVASFSTRAIPHQFLPLSARAEWAGWTQSTELDRLLDEIKEQPTQDEAHAVFEEMQEQFYEDLPMINIGKFNAITSMAENVEDFDELVGPIFWNVNISEEN